MPPEASSLPSGLAASVLTAPVWPANARNSRPEANSQILIVLSKLPVAIHRSSGLIAIAWTDLLCPVCKTSSGRATGACAKVPGAMSSIKTAEIASFVIAGCGKTVFIVYGAIGYGNG
jgi:hypothetical protein